VAYAAWRSITRHIFSVARWDRPQVSGLSSARTAIQQPSQSAPAVSR
jgi:hypothetical protein